MGLGGTGYIKIDSWIQRQSLIQFAKILGFEYFDTAPLYGNGKSEIVLGKSKVSGYKVITKFGLSEDFGLSTSPEMRWQEFSGSSIPHYFQASIERIKVTQVWGYLLHCYSKNVDFSQHIKAMQILKKSEKVRAIGFSIDNIQELPEDYSWADLIEVPIDIADQIVVNEQQTIVINGIYRIHDGVLLLERYQVENPDIDKIVLTGSSSLRHIYAFAKFVKRLNRIH